MTAIDQIRATICKPMTLDEILAEIEGQEYSAELMLHHLLIWAVDANERINQQNK